ncbi:hypothetical protein BX600DRAFT_509416 [Xylariales sp. PMI_506]|nr:hypothetical protein BX600DRAFT_509416 [Xylariales sp. PMI_506]
MVVQLPPEIWLRIFSFLEYSLEAEETAWLQGLRDPPFYLKPVCLVCRDFRALAQPLLYRTLPADQETRHLLFGTLSRRPDLARAVRTLRVSGHRNALEKNHVPFAFSRARSWLPMIVGFAERFSADIWRGSDDANLAFLLILLPNLWHLELEWTEPPQSVLSVFTGTPASSSLHRFPVLKELVLTPGSDDRSSGPGWICDWADVIFHPSIKYFHGKEVIWSRVEAVKMKGCSHNMEELYLEGSLVDDIGFKDILSRYDNLRRLTITWASPGWATLKFNLAELGKALRSKGRKLEHLELDPSRQSQYLGVPFPGMIGSLRELRHLQSLNIAPDLLVTDAEAPDTEVESLRLYSVLPTSLEILHFFLSVSSRALKGWLYEEIDSLLRSDSVPQLREIRADLSVRNSQGILDASVLFLHEQQIVQWRKLGWNSTLAENDEGLIYTTLTRDRPCP